MNTHVSGFMLTSVSGRPLAGSFFLSKGYSDVYLSDIDK